MGENIVVSNMYENTDSEEYIQAMLAKAEQATQITTGVPSTEEPSSEDTSNEEQQPQQEKLLAGKYKSVEDLEKGYKELVKKLGSKQSQQPTKEEPSTAANIEVEAAKEALDSAGLDLNAFSQEYADKGSLSKETYDKLAKAGYSKQLVDKFIAGQEASAKLVTIESERAIQEARQEAFSITQGEAGYNAMAEWASNTLSDAELEAYNSIVEGSNRNAAKFAINSLYARYQSSVGNPPKNLVLGHGSSAVEAYGSMAQMMKDMGDPRYHTDPAFRKQVEQKAFKSKF